MVVNVLLCFVCRHNRRRTFRTYSLLLIHTYSLLLTTCSLSLWRAKRVCVLCGKSRQRGDRRWRGESGSRMRGQSKKEFRTEFSFRERALGAVLKIESVAKRFRVST